MEPFCEVFKMVAASQVALSARAARRVALHNSSLHRCLSLLCPLAARSIVLGTLLRGLPPRSQDPRDARSQRATQHPQTGRGAPAHGLLTVVDACEAESASTPLATRAGSLFLLLPSSPCQNCSGSPNFESRNPSVGRRREVGR